MNEPRWLTASEVGGEVVFRIGRMGSCLVADWPELGRLFAFDDGGQGAAPDRREGRPRTATWVDTFDADPVRVAKLKRGPVRALLRHLQGDVTLHAATVGLPAGAVSLIGDSGDGKSTLAASLCRGHGCELLGDDVAFLRQTGGALEVTPAFEDHVLTRESCLALSAAVDPAREKTFVAAPRASQPRPLLALVTLRFAEGPPRITPIGGMSSVHALFHSMARFAIDDRLQNQRDLAWAVDTVARIPVLELCRPRNLTEVDASARALVEYFAAS